jgi:hypothetical protein
MRLGERMRPYLVPEEKRPKQAGEIKNISISNIQAVGVKESNDFISGIPGHFIENVTLNDIRISYLGGGKKEDSNIEIPELPGEYPKAKMFGVLPAYGMYIRHARNIVMNNVQYYFGETDNRSAIVCEDVENITIEGMQAESSVDAAPLIKLKDTNDACIRYSKALDETDLFLYAEGNSGDITLEHNFYSNSRNKYKLEIMESENAIKIIE